MTGMAMVPPRPALGHFITVTVIVTVTAVTVVFVENGDDDDVVCNTIWQGRGTH